jgi:hypothetical protein
MKFFFCANRLNFYTTNLIGVELAKDATTILCSNESDSEKVLRRMKDAKDQAAANASRKRPRSASDKAGPSGA